MTLTYRLCKIMSNDIDNCCLEQQKFGDFPSYCKNPIFYRSKMFTNLLNAKAILSFYGYKRHKTYFDVVTKNDLCFNIIFDEKGFTLKQI